jgi:hypothetical protein
VTGHSGHAADGTLRPAACERTLLYSGTAR